MRKKAYLRTIEVTIAIIITFAVAYFIMPRASVTADDFKISVLPILEQKQEFRDCVMQLNYGCVEEYLRNFVPANYEFTFDIAEDSNTLHAGLPDKRISAESVYISGTNNPGSINKYGLVLAYNFDKNITEGDYTPDASDLNNDGRVLGPIWVSEGYYGGSYLFDGSNDYITSYDRSNINNFPLTMMAWIKTGDGPILWTEYHYLYGASLSVENDKLVANFNDGTGGFNKKTGITNLQNGVWYSVAAVIRGNNNMDLYINGVDDGGFYSGFATSFGSAGYPAFVGVGPGGNYFSGQIGPVRLYNRALSASEVTNMNVVPTEINLYNPKIIKVYYWRKE